MSSSRVVRFLPVLVLALVVGGCGDDQPSAGRSGGSSPSASPSASASSSATTTEPSVAPANGQELSNDTVSLRLTDDPDWNVSQFATTMSGSLLREDGAASVTVSDIRSTGAGDLESLASVVPRSRFDGYPAPKRMANREIDGVESFVFETSNAEYHRYVVGGVHDGFDFNIDFEVPVVWADGDALIQQMLASVEIKDHEG